MNLRRIAVLAWKDILDAIRTSRLLMIIITPLLVALAIEVFFGNKLFVRVGVFSSDSTQLIAVLEQVELVDVQEFYSVESLNLAVKNNKVTVGVILPSNFDKLLAANQMPQVDFLLADNSQESQIGLSVIKQVLQSMSSNALPVHITVKILEPMRTNGISLRGDLDIDQYAIVLWLIMGIVGNSVMLVTTLIVEEKERKTLGAILLTPATYLEVATSKALVGVLYSAISSFLIIGVQGKLAGDIFFIIALILLGSFSLSLLGVLIGNLSKNLHVLNSYGSLFIFLLTMPTFIGMLGPNPMVQYLQFLPTYFLTQGFVYVLSGRSGQAGPDLIALSFYCFLALMVVSWSLKKYKIGN